MGRVGTQARQLHHLLAAHGVDAELEGSFRVPRPSNDRLAPRLLDEAMEVYYALASVPQKVTTPAFRPDSWDMRIDCVLVEFDEARHFNRYRAITLRSVAYQELPAFPLVA